MWVIVWRRALLGSAGVPPQSATATTAGSCVAGWMAQPPAARTSNKEARARVAR